MKKLFLTFVLAMLMVSMLVVGASAATPNEADQAAVTDAVLAVPQSITATNAVPTSVPVMSGAQTLPYGNGYLYWADAVVGQPSLVYDQELNQYFLRFGLSDESKLATLYNENAEAFCLVYNLDRLIRWLDPYPYIEGRTSGWSGAAIIKRLSNETVEMMAEMSCRNAYGFLEFIATRPECASDSILADYVEDEMKTIELYAHRVTLGLNQLGLYQKTIPAGLVPLTELTPYELALVADDFVYYRREAMWALDKVRTLVGRGTTSKTITSLYEADTNVAHGVVSDLYRQITAALDFCWHDRIFILNDAVFALPLTPNMAYAWTQMNPAEPLPPVPPVVEPVPTTAPVYDVDPGPLPTTAGGN